jgi:hypothetical protein
MSSKNTSPDLPGEGIFLTSSPVGSRNTLFEGMVLFFTFVGGSRRHILSRSSSGFFCACKQRVAIANHGSI